MTIFYYLINFNTFIILPGWSLNLALELLPDRSLNIGVTSAAVLNLGIITR